LQLAADPANSSVLYLVEDYVLSDYTHRGGTYKSEDAGRTWRMIDTRPALRLTVTTKAVYVTFFTNELYASRDGGATWEPASWGLPPPLYTSAVIADALDPNVTYVSTNGHIYVSTTGGF
jgi:photosystem II stability/assembly factor-like uncharacterized protein